MKRSRLRPVGSRKRNAASVFADEMRDCHGVAYGMVRGIWLPERVADWPKANKVTNPVPCRLMHDWHGLFGPCWRCGERPRGALQVHHIFSTAIGRSDELTNLFMACPKCHEKIQHSPAELPRVLFAKWTRDWQHTNWVRLNILAGKWLPDISEEVRASCP